MKLLLSLKSTLYYIGFLGRGGGGSGDRTEVWRYLPTTQVVPTTKLHVLESDKPVFDSQLCHFQAVWTLGKLLNLLKALNMGEDTQLTMLLCVLNVMTPGKHLVNCLACGRDLPIEWECYFCLLTRYCFWLPNLKNLWCWFEFWNNAAI